MLPSDDLLKVLLSRRSYSVSEQDLLLLKKGRIRNSGSPSAKIYTYLRLNATGAAIMVVSQFPSAGTVTIQYTLLSAAARTAAASTSHRSVPLPI